MLTLKRYFRLFKSYRGKNPVPPIQEDAISNIALVVEPLKRKRSQREKNISKKVFKAFGLLTIDNSLVNFPQAVPFVQHKLEIQVSCQCIKKPQSTVSPLRVLFEHFLIEIFSNSSLF